MINSKCDDFVKFILLYAILPAYCLATLYSFNPFLYVDICVIFDILASIAIFSLFVYSHEKGGNNFIRITGIAFFIYGTLEFISLLFTSNSGILLMYSDSPLLSFSLLGKSIRSCAFLAAPLLIGRSLSSGRIFLFFILSILISAGLILPDLIPASHTGNGGLVSSGFAGLITASSYLVSLALLARKRHFFNANIFRYVSISLFLFSISGYLLLPVPALSPGIFFLGTFTNILALLAISKAFLLECFNQPYSSLLAELEQEKNNFLKAANIYTACSHNPFILFCILDPKGNLLTFNRACEMTTGYSETEVINTNMGDYFSNLEDREYIKHFFTESGSRSLPFAREIYWSAKNGKTRLIKWHMQAVMDANGDTSSILCTGADITGCSEIGKDLRFKNLVLDRANDSILVHSPSGKILYVNKAFLEQTGYKNRDISALSFETLESAQCREHNRFRFDRLKRRGRAKFESTLVRRDGNPVQVELSSAMADVDGENVIISVVRDNSARKLFHKNLKDRYNELSALYKISAAVSNSLNFDELFPKILDSIIELDMLDVEREGGIFVLENDTLKLVSSAAGQKTFSQSPCNIKIGECLCGLAAKRGEIVLTRDVSKESRYRGNATGEQSHGHISIPLHSRKRLVGVMSLYLHSSSRIDEPKINLLQAIGNQVAVALENAGLYEEMKNLALHDPLTGFANRRLMDIVFERSMAEAKRFHEPLSVLMADIDYFKHYNDTFGHAAGDELLVRFAGVISEQVREIDFVSRYGGEEFFLILPGTSLDAARFVAERIRQEVHKVLGITVSLGVAVITQDCLDKEELIMRADCALYRAKQNGRNRVETAS